MKTLRTTIAAALLACAALGAHAAPGPYTSSTFASDAVAVAGAVADVDSKASPLEPPLISTAVAISGADFASASGFAGSGLLVAQAEASSATDAVSAVGTASFEGVFSMTGAGVVTFKIDLLDQNFTDAGQFSEASLFFKLTFEGTTYADVLLTGSSSPYALNLNLPGAGTGMFSLLLASEASALQGNASNFAQAEFMAAVPEPGQLTLLLAGLALVGVVMRSRRSSGAPTIA